MEDSKAPQSTDGTAQLFLAIGSCSAAISVIAGAFGAHALRGTIEPELFAAFETAVRYQMYHALALVALALTGDRLGETNAKKLRTAGFFFILGTVLFSGSLYLMVFTGSRWVGAITPFGGLLFIAGWLVLVWVGLRAVSRRSNGTR